jgi:hypothetical protein
MTIGNHDPYLGARQAAGRICQFTALDSPGTHDPGAAQRAAICGKLRQGGQSRRAAKRGPGASGDPAGARGPGRRGPGMPVALAAPVTPAAISRPTARHMYVHARDSLPALPSSSGVETKCDRPVTAQHGRGWDLPSDDFAGQQLWHSTIIVAGWHRALSSGTPATAGPRHAPSVPHSSTLRDQHVMASEKAGKFPATRQTTKG